jgi:hypothetical protein
MNVFTAKQPIKNNYVKVIRRRQIYDRNASWWTPENNQDNYYSSLLGERQYIYAFLNVQAAKKCYQFLKKYKDVNGRYPDLHGSQKAIKPVTEESFTVYIDEEPLRGLKKRCSVNGIGLIGISEFDYTFIDTILDQKNVFSLNLSATDLLSDQVTDDNDKIENLNYLLDF